jgi:hypothetical protein
MKLKRTLFSILAAALIAGTVAAQQLTPTAFPFVGRWNPSENPLLLDDYGLQDIQNLRKDGKHFKGVSGHTAINTEIPSIGTELVTNGGFASAETGWTGNNATLASVAGGQTGNCLEVTRTGGTNQAAYQAYSGLTVGLWYRLTAYVKSGTSGNEAYIVSVDDGITAYSVGSATGTSSASWVQVTLNFKATSATGNIVLTKNTATAGTMLFDTVSLSPLAPHIVNGFHFRKDQPAESHVIVYAADTATPTAGKLFQSTTGPPAAGNFSTTALHSPSAFNDVWRFSSAPAGNMVAANGDATLIWGGNEIEATSFLTSSAAVTYTLTNANDYSEILSNTRQTADQVATLADTGFTKLLLHGDGADGAAPTDSGPDGVVISSASTAYVDTDQLKFGTGSILFSAASQQYLSAPDSVSWSFGTDVWTIDFWVRFRTVASAGLFSQYDSGTDKIELTYNNGLHQLLLSIKGISALNVSFTPVVDTWYHIAVIRGWGGDSTKFTITANGVSLGTVTDADDCPDLGAAFEIGRSQTGVVTYLDGWIDEFRVSKGLARWTTTYTVPTQAGGNGTNTFLIGSKRPLQGVKLYILNGNTTTSTLTMKEWQGSWVSQTITDGTAVGGKTLAQTGAVTWTYTGNAKPRYINGLSLYWYQFSFSAGQASLYYVTTDAPIQTIKNIWDGVEYYPVKFLKYDGTTYQDYTDQVGDGSDSTYATLSSLTSSHALYVGFLDQQQALSFKFVAGKENANASVLTLKYWDGSAWTALSAQNDGTAAGGVTLSKGGVVSFQGAAQGTEFKRAIADEFPLYYYQATVSATLDADVQLAGLTGIAAPPAMSTFKFSEVFQNKLFLFNEKSGAKNKAVYSVTNAPDIFNGSDSGEITFGDKTELTAAAVVYNVFTDSAVEQLLVAKKNETWRLSGDSTANWTLKKISSNVGCVAPLTMVSAEATDTSPDQKRTVAIWVSDRGPVMSTGSSIIPIFDDVKCYWDPRDSRYIPTTMQSKSVAWYDTQTRSYKLLIASGSTATFLNTELEFSLANKEWTKIYRENAAGANPLQCGFPVWDTNGVGYTYGGGKDGFVYRLENGNTWNAVANITSYLQTKDLILDDQKPLFRKSTMKYLRTAYKKKNTGTITISHYGDGTITTSGVSGQAGPAAITNEESTVYNSQSVNLGPWLFHSLKYSVTSSVADGLEITGIGIYSAPENQFR